MSKLKIFLNTSKCEKSLKAAQIQFDKLDQLIQEKCSLRNVKIVEDHISNFSIDGHFCQTGLWKLRSKLHPKQLDPPMAKLDTGGNLITAPPLLRKLYLDTYVHRLRHREMKADLMDLFEMKTTLWNYRLDCLKANKSEDWQPDDLKKILKKLKNNKSRDPSGFINEIFKPGVIGNNLQEGLLHLSNLIKTELQFPSFMQEANITTIWKRKGSRLSLESDRGIFVINVLKKCIDQLIYEDKYGDIDENMSDSNIGGRKNMNIKNHLFIIYGIMNNVVNGKEGPIDIQVYDLEKAFDALWLEDSMNDLVDSLPASSQDDKVALIFEANRSNKVAINTSVGQTERVEIPRIVMQGGTWGPLKCSNTIDKIGEKCYERGEHLYLYKDRVRILPLGMVDDILAVSRCGHESVALNTYLTTQIEMKKLRFHVPDAKGKTKCHQFHVGKPSTLCPELLIHGYPMEKVNQDTYLGDIISFDASNSLNIKDRVGKGVGIMSDILNDLESVSFGFDYFRIFKIFREARFINGTLTNADIWYGLDSNSLKELEDLDRLMIRKVLKCPFSTPTEAGHLELGFLPLHCLVKERRMNYFHYILKGDPNKMLHKFLVAQWENEVKNDWTQTIKEDF